MVQRCGGAAVQRRSGGTPPWQPPDDGGGPSPRRDPRSAGFAGRRRQRLSGDVAKLLRFGERLELLERLVLDLADALARDVERPPDLIQRSRVLPAEAVPQLEHAPLAVG